MASKRDPITAAELMERLKTAPEHQKRLRAKEQAREAAVAAASLAAQPVVEDLVSAGVAVARISDVLREPKLYPAAVPVLISWLPRVQNVDVKEDIVRALSMPAARPKAAGPLIAELKRSQDHDGLSWAIGNALEVVGGEADVDDLLVLAQEPRYGRARQMIVLALGKMKDGRVIPLLLRLLNDEDVVGHAVMALGKLKDASVRDAIASVSNHPVAWIRKEAQKAIARIDKLPASASRAQPSTSSKRRP